MDTVLIFLGVLGFSTVVMAAFVFTSATRIHARDDQRKGVGFRNEIAARRYRERSATDRRSGEVVTFPLVLDGVIIKQDRRTLPDRRMAGA